MPQDYKQLIYNIIGAAMEVHRELGWGLQEPIYTESLHLELLNRSIENDTEKHLPCYYKNRLLEKYYQMDIVVGDIVVELKSVSSLLPVHRAQLFNYMRLTKARLDCSSILESQVFKVKDMLLLKEQTSVFCSTRT